MRNIFLRLGRLLSYEGRPDVGNVTKRCNERIHQLLLLVTLRALLFFATQGEALHDKHKATCEDEVEHQGEYRDEQYGATDVVAEGDEDDTCTHLATGEHTYREAKALLE